MSKWHILCILIGLFGICASFSQEQEFIKQPKAKRVCPSRQQHIELNARIVDMSNDLLHYFNTVSQIVITLQKKALSEINGYMNSDKECLLNTATKKRRAELYRIKEQFIAEMPKMIDFSLQLKEKVISATVAF